MRVAVIQSSYIPWRGYFDFIASVDRFVVYDDVQYSSGSWRNRNRLKMPEGLRWITVPVRASVSLAIDEVPISEAGKPWRNHHREMLERSLGEAPHFDDARRIWGEAAAATLSRLSELNIRLLAGVCEYLRIATPIVTARPFGAQGSKTRRLVDLLQKVGATMYLSGPTARAYLEESLFREAGIGLAYKSFDYAEYPQRWGAFAGAVTVLDLIANTGPAAREFLRSRSADEIVLAPAPDGG